MLFFGRLDTEKGGRNSSTSALRNAKLAHSGSGPDTVRYIATEINPALCLSRLLTKKMPSNDRLQSQSRDIMSSLRHGNFRRRQSPKDSVRQRLVPRSKEAIEWHSTAFKPMSPIAFHRYATDSRSSCLSPGTIFRRILCDLCGRERKTVISQRRKLSRHDPHIASPTQKNTWDWHSHHVRTKICVRLTEHR